MILLSPAFLCLPHSHRRMVWILGQFLQDQVEKRWQGNSSSTLQMREISAEMLSVFPARALWTLLSQFSHMLLCKQRLELWNAPGHQKASSGNILFWIGNIQFSHRNPMFQILQIQRLEEKCFAKKNICSRQTSSPTKNGCGGFLRPVWRRSPQYPQAIWQLFSLLCSSVVSLETYLYSRQLQLGVVKISICACAAGQTSRGQESAHQRIWWTETYSQQGVWSAGGGKGKKTA